MYSVPAWRGSQWFLRRRETLSRVRALRTSPAFDLFFHPLSFFIPLFLVVCLHTGRVLLPTHRVCLAAYIPGRCCSLHTGSVLLMPIHWICVVVAYIPGLSYCLHTGSVFFAYKPGLCCCLPAGSVLLLPTHQVCVVVAYTPGLCCCLHTRSVLLLPTQGVCGVVLVYTRGLCCCLHTRSVLLLP